MAHPYWPLFDLRVTTPLVELRLPSDDDLVALARLAAQGVHEPGSTPFLKDWANAPSPELERGLLQWGWRHRAEWRPESWVFNAAVVHDGEVVGVQDLAASQFAVLRGVHSGSWLGRRFQGRHLGREMRAAVLHLAFEGLGALRATSGAMSDNPASSAVSAALGYATVGDDYLVRDGERTRHHIFVLERGQWLTKRRSDINIVGLEECRAFFDAAHDARPT